jgi:4-amino-4-deoxy-L-arabinose transferase-like glycosyltransferase
MSVAVGSEYAALQIEKIPRSADSLPFSRRRLWAAAGLLVIACALYLLGFPSNANVVRQSAGDSANTHWVWLDFVSNPTSEGSFEGQLALPASRTLYVENTIAADVRLWIDGEPMFHGMTPAQVRVDDTLPSVVPVRFEYRLSGLFPPRGRLGLLQDGMLGVRSTIPAWQFVGTASTNPGVGIARLLFPVALGGAGLLVVSSLRLTRRDWLGLGLLLALALTVQWMVLSEKFANNAGLWSMDAVWDNYVAWGRDWLAGRFPIADQAFQQGNFIYMGLAQLALGPDLRALYLLNSLLAGLCPLLLALAGWALYDRTTGYIAGIMAAGFAPLLHYQQTLQPESPLILLMCLLIAAGVALYRWRDPFFVLACGVAVGLMTLLRGSMLVMMAWVLFIILIQPLSGRMKAGFSALALLAAVFILLPVTVTNFNAGVYILTPSRSDEQLFRANNRNSMGLNTYLSQAERLALARGDDWMDALKREIARDPWRLVELTIRRLGLFWEREEHSEWQMINYRATSLDFSPTLRALALNEVVNFRLLASLGLVGLVVGLADASKRGHTRIIAAGLLAYMVTLAVFYVTGRLRIHAAGFVILLAATGVVALWRLRVRPRRLLLTLAVASAGILAMWLLADWLVATFPRPELIQERDLPADFTPVQASYNGEIRLLGYAHYDSNFEPGGYLTFELFWRALAVSTENYVVTVRLVNAANSQIESIQNFTLGTLSDPKWPNPRWNPGDIYYERYLLALPEKPGVYHVFVGLYSHQRGRVLPLSEVAAEARDDHARLTAVTVQETAAVSAAPSEPPVAVWADALALQDVSCQVGEHGLTLNLAWYVRERPTRAEHLFVHVWQEGRLAAQQDAPPDERIPVDAWLPATTHRTTRAFPDITTPAVVRLGFYEPFTQERWPISVHNDVWTVVDNYIEFSCP